MRMRVGTSTFAAVLGAVLIAACGSSSSSNQPGSPDASAAGLFPHTLDHAHLLRSSAASTARRAYTFNLSGLPHRSEYLVVDCAGGNISIDIGPGAHGEKCHAHPAGVATYCGGFPPSIVVEVSDPQQARWGAAIYTAPPSIGC